MPMGRRVEVSSALVMPLGLVHTHHLLLSLPSCSAASRADSRHGQNRQLPPSSSCWGPWDTNAPEPKVPMVEQVNLSIWLLQGCLRACATAGQIPWGSSSPSPLFFCHLAIFALRALPCVPWLSTTGGKIHFCLHSWENWNHLWKQPVLCGTV